MTDQDNLRDRIAGVLAETYSPGGRGVQFEDAVAAQAIIDELDLTIEPHCEECEHKVIEGWWGKQ